MEQSYRGEIATRKRLQNRFSKALKLAAVAVGSWRFWVGSAFAAVTAAVITAVAYTVFFANSGAGSYPYSTLGGDRILLMNADINETCPVGRQGYGDVRTATVVTNYWVHSDEATCSLFYYKSKGYDHTYWKDDDTRLWSLKNCRFGNTWVDNKSTFVSTQNYLPFSSTARRVGASSAAIGTNPHYSGQIVMQNTPDSRVVSSCLEGGIGTIYFDAVNGFTGYKLGELTVEVAYGVFKTNPDGSVVGTRIPEDLELERDEEGSVIPGRYVKPDDAHCDEIVVNRWTPEGGVEQATTNAFGRCAWIAVNLSGVSRCNGSTAALAPRSSVKLEMPLSGNAGSYKNFYRVWAPVQDPSVNSNLAAVCNLPMRFRIRRLDDPRTVSGNSGMGLDGEGLPSTQPYRNGLILIDNVIASYPAMKAMAIPGGEYVAGGSSRNVIGWTGVMTPDPSSPVRHYPKIGEKLFAVAGFEFFTNAPPAAVSPDTWLARTQAKMMYRFRYLAATNDWKEIGLKQSDGRLVSDGEIDLDPFPGDIEYYYDTVLDAPYYAYVDYSGTTELSDPTPGYRERIDHVESHFDASVLPEGTGLPSTGTEFFTRLREGASDQLEYRLEIRREVAGAWVVTDQPFHLTGDRSWKAFIRTTTNETSLTSLPVGDYEFRIVGVDPAVAYAGAPVAELPWAGQPLHVQTATAPSWTPITLDAVTGALMFQLVEPKDPTAADAVPSYTVVHAAYQDFTTWSDAKETPPAYVGAFWDKTGKSGTSGDTREFPCELSFWSATAVSNAAFWTESFLVNEKETPEQGWGTPIRYPAYEVFASCNSRQGWQARNSQWTCAKWRESALGGDMALQLGGAAKGSFEFTNQARMPQGVDTVRLKARVAESAKFSNFEYYMGEGLKSLTNYIFTTRVAMSTTDASTSFDGNGSVSLVGYYQPNKGCYEFRAERTANDTVTFYLYKWAIDPATGEVTPTLLGRHASTRNFTTYTYLRCSNAGNTSALQGSAYYGEMFIRCYKDASNAIVVEAGMMSGSSSNNTYKKLSESCSSTTHYVFKYTDDSTNPFTFGSFGFGSLNCPAQFIKPQLYRDGTKGSFPSVSTSSKNAQGGNVTNPKCGYGTVTYPTTGTIEDVFKLDSVDQKNTYEGWLFNTNRFTLGTWTGSSYRGVNAQPPRGELDLVVTDADQKVLKNLAVTVAGFTYDTNCEFRVRNVQKSLVKLVTGKSSGDIVVDDVALSQWTAGSYDDDSVQDFDDWRPGQACPERYVYVNGCVHVNVADAAGTVTNRFIRLEPARATCKTEVGDKPVSIRAPLMDGLNDFSDRPEMRRGLGLGMISFSYEAADSNCVVLVQYKEISGSPSLKAPTDSAEGWTTIATYDFSKTNDLGRASGVRSTFLGYHGQAGAMRLVIDPQVVKDSQNRAKNPESDPAYGSIVITDFLCRDEPPIDEACWWGWNLRTTDADDERSIYDSDPAAIGMALALNNSVIEDTKPDPEDESDPDRKARFAQNLPFVQTPTFLTNVVGEIAFRARRLPGWKGFTEVAVLGAKYGGDDQWHFLTNILVKSDVYERYAYKTRSGEDYAAFRLAVIGVDDLKEGVPDYREKMDPAVPVAQRVLIDEIEVSEAVRGQIGFFKVGAFRKPLDRNEYVPNLDDIEQQPMCEEAWSVQCELRKVQLEDEVILDDSTEVWLSWYVGKDRWGYSKWRDRPAGRAKLARIPGRSDFTYRGSYPAAPGAVVDPSYGSGTVVQYILEAKFRMADGTDVTSVLGAGEWTKPPWYAGVDYNAEFGDFAAYTILDTVAYGYAWINEVNVYDGPGVNSDQRTNQFVEVAVPAEADIRGWKLQFITGGIKDTDPYYTNTVVTFSDPAVIPDGVPCRKPGNLHEDSGYVFITAGNPKSATPELKAGGYIDGAWRLKDGELYGSQLSSSGEINCGMPMGIRLVRPSGIIEHQIVIAGTNSYEIYGPPYDQNYSATNFVAKLRKLEPDSTWYFTGHDYASPSGNAVGVTNYTGVVSDAGVWAHLRKTPGEKNDGEWIPPTHPHPEGEMFLLTARLLDGYLNQTIGAYVETTNDIVLYVRKGLPGGTNITYNVTNWHEIVQVTETETGRGTKTYGPFPRQPRVSIPIAKYASNDVTVVAKTQRRSDLGLTDDNPYTPAIMAWLERGTWGRGDSTFPKRGFADPNGDIVLAELHDLADNYVCDIDLRSMYWLDMDPTLGGIVLQTGFSEAAKPKNVTRKGPGGTSVACKDCLCTVMLKIKSKTGAFEPYAPYTLNGLTPLSTSREDGASGWDAVTFKITARLLNDRDDLKDPDKVWMPVRYFVFDENSFENFQAKIQVVDPFYQFTDWTPWKDTTSAPVYKFYLDTRKFGAVSSELLRPDSTFK